jgi:hypothetical protein
MSNARYEDDLVDSVVSFPAKNATKPSDQLDKAGQTILQLVQKAAGVADQNSRHALGMAQSFPTSCVPRRIALRSWRRKLLLVRAGPSAPSNGSIASIRRLKTDFFSRNDSHRPMSGAPQRLQNARRSR